MRRMIIGVAAFVAVAALGVGQARAIPILQLYAEGATYDPVSESWVLDMSSGQPYLLWAIGNISGPGGKGTISDVRMSIAYEAEFAESVSISLSPATASDEWNSVADLYLPGEAVRNYGINTTEGWFEGDLVDNGGAPVLSSGKPLPSHGTFGEGMVWQEWSLPDFDNDGDALIGDFIDTFPTDLYEGGQIHAYEVDIDGAHSTTIHFDLYDHVGSKNKAVFAPFSHDAQITPEPATLIIWSLLGALGFTIGWWRRGRGRSLGEPVAAAPPARRAWSEEKRAAITAIIERGRYR